MGGAKGIADLVRGSASARSILESGGFVLEEVMRDAGFTVQVGQPCQPHSAPVDSPTDAVCGPGLSRLAQAPLFKWGARRQWANFDEASHTRLASPVLCGNVHGQLIA